MSVNNGNVVIQIKKPLGERQENIVSQHHNTFKQIKGDVIRKEVFGVGGVTKLSEKHAANLTNETMRRIDAATQSENNVTSSDLTSSDDASASYYKRLAEQRRDALQQTLLENKHLNDRIESLEEELDTSRKELDEAVQLTEILKEFLADGDGEVIDENAVYVEDFMTDH